MRFLMIPTPAPGHVPPTEEPAFDEATFSAYMKYNEDMHLAGVLVASEGVLPGRTGAHITVRGGKRAVMDGPFTETKELVAGFWLIDVKSKAEAVQWAAFRLFGAGRLARANRECHIRPVWGSGARRKYRVSASIGRVGWTGYCRT